MPPPNSPPYTTTRPLLGVKARSHPTSTNAASKTGVGGTVASQFSPVTTNMGNGASATKIVIDGETLDLVKIKQIIPELRRELKLRDAKLHQYEKELIEKTRQLEDKILDAQKLKEEVHKLKSVLQLKVHKDGKPDVLAAIGEEATTTGPERSKKQGVSGESPMSQGVGGIEIKHFEKDFRYVHVIHIYINACYICKYVT